ncbi:hypothetical protein [Streptantibioticus ferralitis]|uniref:Uncharacterized protein n=1 Tax=Streptantibioticus ferralitis TaxID=236510 RepID=A0ABT5Z3Y1_9ACTN|nr:hypothetical protein [Streptantibioticus ferralitis]MDF2258531.1 hypothetical protein [Streptantibioticus ferralitis]
MRRHGINYDTGFDPFGDGTSRTYFDPDTVRRDMAVIADELRCDAIRISGGDPARLTIAAEAAGSPTPPGSSPVTTVTPPPISTSPGTGSRRSFRTARSAPRTSSAPWPRPTARQRPTDAAACAF